MDKDLDKNIIFMKNRKKLNLRIVLNTRERAKEGPLPVNQAKNEACCICGSE
jgi:hypothetical protein